MANLLNTVNDKSLYAAVGSPTLGGTDVLRVAGGTNQTDYTESLDAMSTAIAEAYFLPAYTGMVGDGLSPLLLQAGVISVASGSPSVALKGDNSGTVSRFDWLPRFGATGEISLYDTITLLRVMAAGRLRVLGSAALTTAYVGPSAHLLAEDGDAATTVVVAGVADLRRDVGTLSVHGSGVARCLETTVTPATFNVHGTAARAQAQGSTCTVNIGAGGTFDMSLATSDLTVTWNPDGPFTVVEPPEGVGYTAPPDIWVEAGLVTFRPAGS